MATVASTVYAFTQKNPKAWILATGSTSVRTRLYRMGITNNLAENELLRKLLKLKLLFYKTNSL